MFVVRRSFRNYNQMMLPGSIVEPGSIKRFKSHLRDRDIVEVSERDLDKWNAYFLSKYSVPIGPLANEPKDNAPEGNAPEGNAPEGNAPEGNAPEGNAPEGNAPEVKPVVAAAVKATV